MVNDELLGKQLGSYQLVQLLGHGAFGSVYLGKHFLLEHRPPVAIKVLKTTLSTQDEVDRFFQEAVLLDELTHPNILPIFDANLYEGFPFFVTEYAPGGSLRDRLDQLGGNPMQLDEAIRLLNQVGQGLQHAHDLNVVHRDIKPANILFNANGDAMLADFGIALQLQKTRRVDEIGTPPYMAPEQFKGQVSKKSDQYALACVAYELVTGQQLFEADDPYTMGYKHIYEPPIDPRDLNPDIPLALEEVILKALSKRRDDRYATVADFVLSLQRAVGISEGASEMIAEVEQVELHSVSEQQSQPVVDTRAMEASGVVQPQHEIVPRVKRATRSYSEHQTEPAVSQQRPLARPATPITGGSSRLALAWSVTTEIDHTYYSEPAAVNGIIYAGTYTTADRTSGDHNQLRALDTSTGEQRWAFSAEFGIYDAPVVVDNVVYFSSGDINKRGKVYALNASTGQPYWSFGTEEYLKAMPSVVDGTVYAHSQHAVYALNAATGEEYWSVTLKAALSNRPAIVDGIVYLGTELGNCYVLDAAFGKKRATFTDVGEVQTVVKTINGINCICSFDGELYAFDMTTGEVRWTLAMDKHISGGLTVDNGIAYVGSHGGFVGDSANTKLSAIDVATGELCWMTHVKHEIESAPVVANGVIYISTFGHELYAIGAQQGNLLFSTGVGRGRINRPAVADGMLFVSTGEMYAFHLNERVS
jgi:serine/threonine protein kinase/outer membrane protein assembly factor BamB